MPPGATQPTVIACPRCHSSYAPPGGQLASGTYQSACPTCGHRFKFRSVVQPRATVDFTLNGRQYTVDGNHDTSMSLNEFIREVAGLKGTKVTCQEGGCGCCVVSAARFDPVTSSDITLAVNSCLCPVWICDGWHIMTTEGLGNEAEGYHPIQSRLAEGSGSQCGWCSPGMVMNMYSLLQENPTPSSQQVENSFDGNICRCTGYRPILDAMKTFAVDDIEDVAKTCCKKGGRGCSKKSCKLLRLEPLYMVLKNGTQWMRPASLVELYELLDIYKEENYMLVFGNTSSGVFGGQNNVYIDIRGILELYTTSLVGNLEFGANLTLNQVAELFDQAAASVPGYAYCANHAAHIRKMAGTPVRNAGCWAGNIMMKHAANGFASDVFLILEAVNAVITVGNSEGTSEHTPLQLLDEDMTGKAIIKVTLPPLTAQDVVRTFKVMPRSQNTPAVVNAGFYMRLDAADNYRVLQQPSIVYGGMGAQQNHAAETEAYLTGKQLGDPTVLAGALEILQGELTANEDPALTSTTYRRELAISLFYKYVLGALSDVVDDRLKSGADELFRPVSQGTQDFDTDPEKYPLTQPMPKRTAKAQTAGEAQFVGDIPPVPGQLYAAFVISTEGNATLSSIDATEALLMPGVVDFVSASDIPEGGFNSFVPPPNSIEPVFVEIGSPVEYAGQGLGIIVADSQARADTAARAVQVTYTNVQPALTDFEQAIDQGSFFPKPGNDLIAGDAEGAIAGSPHVIEGEVLMGTQAHFHLETFATVCVPEEDGMDIVTTTQWVDSAQQAVAQVLGTLDSRIRMKVKRCGGGFGAKQTRNNQMAAACALAANKLRKPVRIMTNFNTQMEIAGKRFPYKATYQVGVESDGKLNGVIADLYTDCGHSPNDNSIWAALLWMDNAYFCENWHLVPAAVRTNLPSNTFCRSPGSLPAVFIMEYIIEQIAKTLNLDPLEVRKLNYYEDGQLNQISGRKCKPANKGMLALTDLVTQMAANIRKCPPSIHMGQLDWPDIINDDTNMIKTTPNGQPLNNVNIAEMTAQLEVSADIIARKQEIQAFNEANRWKKRALSVAAVKWGMPWGFVPFNVFMSVYSRDGSVALAHGGVECGQGTNMKTLQVAAYKLGIPIEMIYVRPTEDFANANNFSTGGNCSELTCLGVIECCNQLLERLEPYSDLETWQEKIQAAFSDGVDMTARHWLYLNEPYVFRYFCYGIACTEVEMDVLTGQYQIPRSDIIYDAGESPNPDIDVGQVEGAFVMGLGYSLYEKTRYHPTTGQNLTNSTSAYIAPSSKDIPADFRVSLLKDKPNPVGMLGAKGVGEPPMCGSCSSWFAVKQCAEAAREENEQDSDFRLDVPVTVEDAQQACLNDIRFYVLQ